MLPTFLRQLQFLSAAMEVHAAGTAERGAASEARAAHYLKPCLQTIKGFFASFNPEMHKQHSS